MLSENQIEILAELIRTNPHLIAGEVWGYDSQNKILYSPVREAKLTSVCNSVPPYKKYITLTNKRLEKLKSGFVADTELREKEIMKAGKN